MSQTLFALIEHDFDDGVEFARRLDERSPLANAHETFVVPQDIDHYFCGHSLGVMPKTVPERIEALLEQWQSLGVDAYFDGSDAWLGLYKQAIAPLAKLVGASFDEVGIMGSLTSNLHACLTTFYRPTQDKYAILMESHAFPTDRYAVQAQQQLHGIDNGLIELEDEDHLYTTEAILKAIEAHKDKLALILLPAVQYVSGQLLDIQSIAAKACDYGIPIGVDCAHAIGNVPLSLHDWGIDFAVWCHYKYLNGGPGCVAGFFIHEKYVSDQSLPRLAGWWGHDLESEFSMGKTFKPMKSAQGWQQSCPPMLSMMPLLCSLSIYEQVGMETFSEVSHAMTAYAARCLDKNIHIITPKERGAQWSISLGEKTKALHEALKAKGVLGDYREPNMFRFAPNPLYNTFEQIHDVCHHINQIARELGCL